MASALRSLVRARITGPASRLVWLGYLLLYPVPWAFTRPSEIALLASGFGTVLFVIIFLDATFRPRRTLIPHVLLIAAIGFALAPFGATWTVFNVFAASAAAKGLPRKTALITIVALELLLLGVGLGWNLPWISWTFGLFFGAMVGFGTLLQADLERRHQQLLATQDEVRSLSAAAERERIARDLHDLLGHTLTLVAVKADLAVRLIDRDAAAAEREMREVTVAAREALAEVRTAVAGMKDGTSLAREMERARRILIAADVQTEIKRAEGTAGLQGEAVLAMALREAVTNVIRHSAARSCRISVLREGGGMRLTVADDGTGAGGAALQEGSGLKGMRARLTAAGGNLELHSTAGGTSLIAQLPAAAA